MFNRRMFVALAVCLAVSASSAFAGGNGGTKKDSTVVVNNNTNGPVAAFVGVDPAQASTATTQQQVEALGGRIIQAGSSHSFKVKAGSQPVIVAAVGSGSPVVLVNTSVNAQKGQTIQVNAVSST